MLNFVSEEQKKALRKIKHVSTAVKAVIYGGNIGGPLYASQFHYDVKTYNMYEALCYVSSYESQGKYAPDTASKAVNAALAPEDKSEENDEENPPPITGAWTAGY